MNKEYYNLTEIAEMLSVNKAKIWKLVRAGDIHATNVGTDKQAYYRVSQENLDSFLKKRTNYGEQRPA